MATTRQQARAATLASRRERIRNLRASGSTNLEAVQEVQRSEFGSTRTSATPPTSETRATTVSTTTPSVTRPVPTETTVAPTTTIAPTAPTTPTVTTATPRRTTQSQFTIPEDPNFERQLRQRVLEGDLDAKDVPAHTTFGREIAAGLVPEVNRPRVLVAGQGFRDELPGGTGITGAPDLTAGLQTALERARRLEQTSFEQEIEATRGQEDAQIEEAKELLLQTLSVQKAAIARVAGGNFDTTEGSAIADTQLKGARDIAKIRTAFNALRQGLNVKKNRALIASIKEELKETRDAQVQNFQNKVLEAGITGKFAGELTTEETQRQFQNQVTLQAEERAQSFLEIQQSYLNRVDPERSQLLGRLVDSAGNDVLDPDTNEPITLEQLQEDNINARALTDPRSLIEETYRRLLGDDVFTQVEVTQLESFSQQLKEFVVNGGSANEFIAQISQAILSSPQVGRLLRGETGTLPGAAGGAGAGGGTVGRVDTAGLTDDEIFDALDLQAERLNAQNPDLNITGDDLVVSPDGTVQVRSGSQTPSRLGQFFGTVREAAADAPILGTATDIVTAPFRPATEPIIRRNRFTRENILGF